MSGLSKTNHNKINKLADDDIDYSDIPETDEEFWNDAQVLFPAKKTHLSIRLDDDIISWFKQFGRGYQTKINAVLRSYISNTKKRQSESRSKASS
jgi:uncharacterized protein (DUF4415 family)